MIPQVQDDSRKQHEEQASSPFKEKHALAPASSLRKRKMLKRDKRLQRQRNQHRLNASNICSILLAIGLILIVLGKFLSPNSFIGFIIENSGWVAFLSGIAMFVAIVRTTLDV
ncbi:MAG: hypothetical protein ACXWPS_10105 [Ktedonobacteraceae bacterium]